ncbi:DNA-processing protein DprA [Guptibacillus algicola]|uniref:DNA-processing protein DprA n=1 Tax=Guptibacillus algicola TaxID=225844 RepID=UPI001CD6C78E|nr:DNA-processing protein DprA [Alkalihalobacillus algicola]MCA0988061.1 DNA-processing protein DprA [Alkalihalobacillus algicola]
MSAVTLTNFGLDFRSASRFYRDLHVTKPWKINGFGEMKVITRFDEEYPKSLTHIYDAPWVIYCIGNIRLLNTPSLSVVGTRYPSSHAEACMGVVLTPVVQQNITVVSGLARGVDTLAHRLALRHRSGTVAVLGSGFKHIYPRENIELATDIAKDGLLLTEYPPHRKAERIQFPERNRIISGLSKGTFIVEAKKKSGSLITADQAIEQGRDVYCLPGRLTDMNSVGTNRLIQQGAKLILNSEDILSEYDEFQEKVVSTI